MRIVVVGAGAIGANIAYRLVCEGGDVTLVDPAPGAGTSRASFSWLSTFPQVAWPEPAGQARLRLSVNDRFDRLHEALGGDWLDWSGTLTFAEAVPGFDAAVAGCRAAGIALDLLDAAEIAELAPELRPAPDARAALELRSGWVDAPRMIDLLVRNFQSLGGHLLRGEVAAISRRGDRVTGVELRDGRTLEADMVVLATGAATPAVAAMAGLAIPVSLAPGVMLYAGAGREGLPRQVVNGAAWLARPDYDHGLALHWRGESLTRSHALNGASAAGMLADIARTIPALTDVPLSDVRIGIRAMPTGGPVIGGLPWLAGLYLAVSHGGIGWGPVWAELVAREILQGERVADLAEMRPARFYARDASDG
ncbi:NAD(P)/FAD-dependent oxidoreductase [Acidimangrovimonas sediminis]|uniref:NAD(P)/FAD-dependent oxidoreductase n=1 Tax=Acidimangrovimonas sediminis TaxID=2056283 RepID=UPI000C80D93E|nr:FAD-dependent oxidoreductase [Acidimangrovimonas sediminis]